MQAGDPSWLGDVTYGERLTTPQLLNVAIASLDTAVRTATSTAAATVTIREAADPRAGSTARR